MENSERVSMPIIGEIRRQEVWWDYSERWAGRLNSWGIFDLACVALLEEQCQLLYREGWRKKRKEKEMTIGEAIDYYRREKAAKY